MNQPREVICRYDCHDYENKSYTKVVGVFLSLLRNTPQLWYMTCFHNHDNHIDKLLVWCVHVRVRVCVWGGGGGRGGIHYSSNGIINLC